jgi:hypothetical protein
MKKFGTLFFALAAMTTATHAQYHGKYVGWSTGYIYGGNFPAGVFKAYTHLVNFHVTVTASGGLGTGDLQGGSHASFIAQCHSHGVKAILGIGGEGEHGHFNSACSNAGTQNTLVKNIMDMTIDNGYDGVDLDWEVAEDPNYDNSPANVAKFKAFHQQVVDEVRKHPGLLVTAAITDDWYPNCSASVCAMMDQANGMSYDITAANEYKDAEMVFKLGAPKANHGIGYDMHNLADNLAKCRLAIDSGFGGVMGWDVGKASASVYDSLARYVSHSTTSIVPGPYFVRSKTKVGLAKGAGSELRMYDVKGALMKTGLSIVPMAGNSAGAYVFKPSENSNLQAAKAIVVK